MLQIHRTHSYTVARDEDTSLVVTARAMSAADHRAWEGLLIGNEFVRSFFQIVQAQMDARAKGEPEPSTIEKFKEYADAKGIDVDEYVMQVMESRVTWYETALSLVCSLLVSWDDVVDQEGNPVPSPTSPAEWRAIVDRDPLGEWFVTQLLTMIVTRAKSAAGNGQGGSRSTAPGPPRQNSSAGDGPNPPAAPGGA